MDNKASDTQVSPVSRPCASTLERVLRDRKFAVTAEIVPPRVPNLSVVGKKFELLREVADAINITDNASASVKICSLAVCAYLVQQGGEPVFQVTARDRNRLALQSDLIGAYALGVRNVFAVTGDYINMGDHPAGKPVYDMDSVHIIQMFDKIRKGYMDSGVELRSTPKTPLVQPNFFLGAAANPFGDPMPFHVLKVAKKRLAGADFIQTQCTFDVPRVRDFMAMVVDKGYHERLHFMIGIMPVKSARPLEFMATEVPGMRVPAETITRMKGAQNPEEEGIQMAVETIQQVREIPGVSGIHLMTVSWEAVVPEVLKRAGLMPEQRGVLEIHSAAKSGNAS